MVVKSVNFTCILNIQWNLSKLTTETCLNWPLNEMEYCINHETSYKSSMSKQRRFISGHLSIIIFHLFIVRSWWLHNKHAMMYISYPRKCQKLMKKFSRFLHFIHLLFIIYLSLLELQLCLFDGHSHNCLTLSRPWQENSSIYYWQICSIIYNKCVFKGLFEVFRFIEYEKKVAMIKALEFLTMKCSF
jgi:hypothetical protein